MPTVIRTLLVITAIVVVSNCAFVAPRVEVLGTPGGLARLSGEWWGEYIGDRDHARHGSIAFKLVAGEDHAHGDVLMIPEGLGRPYGRNQWDEPGTPPHELEQRSRMLEIRFVMVTENTVNGVLGPYWDPDRQTEASATFRGRLADDTIEGTFTTSYASGAAKTGGRWKVWRAR
jgi:hypothetical protein